MHGVGLVAIFRYDHAIAQLLYNFPLDHKNSDGNLFWSGPKRPPQVVKLFLLLNHYACR